MDLQTLNLTSIFSLFIFMLMAYKIVTKKFVSTPKLPPGPWKLPIIGNIHNLVGSLPHRRLRDLSLKYGPLMHLKLGEVSTIVVSSAEFAKEVMKTHDLNFASRPPILASEILLYDSRAVSFAPYGDYWRQLRKICTLELLSKKRVQSFQPIREEEVNKLMKLIVSKEGSPINIPKEVMSATSTITARVILGDNVKDHKKFVSVVKESTKVAGGFELGDLYPSAKWLQHISSLRPKLEKLFKQADVIMQNVINEHREAKLSAGEKNYCEKDLVDVLLKEDFGLSDDSIKAVILDLFSAGTESSSTVITWAMAEMIKDPRVMKKLQAEVREAFAKEGKLDESDIENLKYLKAVVKETFRLHVPGPLLLPRECEKGCEIKGYHIPEKSKIIVNAWAIGRNPNHWPEAERFYPERFLESCIDYKDEHFEFIPFGAGRRVCAGITFGLINVEVPLALLMYHFDWKLPNEMKSEDLDMSEAWGMSVSLKHDLHLVPTLYHP